MWDAITCGFRFSVETRNYLTTMIRQKHKLLQKHKETLENLSFTKYISIVNKRPLAIKELAWVDKLNWL